MTPTAEHIPLKILLIEDNKGDAILISKAIKQAVPEGYVLTQATTLEEALKSLSETAFDVALLDRSLPDVDGFNGLHSIQNMAPELPIVFLTAYQDEQTAFQAIEQGAQDYLLKGQTNASLIKKALQFAILRKRYEGVLISRANYDALTGLTNRMLFESRLDMALAKQKRQGGNIAVLFLDLDRFKQVNDTLGHTAGDAVLKEIGGRLKKSVRSYDTAARFGGDEFAILLEGIPDTEHSKTVAQNIIEIIEAPILVSGKKADVGVSIGIAVCTAEQDVEREALLQHVDSAMYEAKAQIGSGYSLYRSEKVKKTT